MNRAGRSLRHVVGSDSTYLMEYFRRDSEHAHWDASTVWRMRRSFGQSFAWGHGSFKWITPTVHLLELGGLTPNNLRYVGVAHMRCATPAEICADLCESGPLCGGELTLHISLNTPSPS